MDRWAGRVALVTGAASGIGFAIAESLLINGMKVVGCDVKPERLKELSDKGELYIVQCDLSKESEILSMFEDIKQKYGGVDVCINSAGVCLVTGTMDGETDKWRQTLEINVLALSICTREAIKSMKRNNVDDGHIVNLCSMAGHKIYDAPGIGMYIASKFAVRTLTETVRKELRVEKSNIRISNISPGTTKTPLIEPVVKDAVNQLIEEKKMMFPKDIASAVIYVLSCPPHVNVCDMLILPTGDELPCT